MFSDRGIVCLDWDERSLRAVDAVLTRSSVRVRRAVNVRIGTGVNVRDAHSLGEFIRKTLAEHRIRSRRAVVDVARQDCVLNKLELPVASTDEMAAMVHMQMARELPFNKDQAVIDFAMSHEEGSESGDVWVAAVRNPVVDFYRDVVTAAGLKLVRIGLRPNAILAAVTADGDNDGRVLVVDIGPAMTEIDVIHNGRLVFCRAAQVAIPMDGLTTPSRAGPLPAPEPVDPADADETIPLAAVAPEPHALDALMVEVSRTVQAYRASDPGAQIDRIVLSGSCDFDDHVIAAVNRRFNLPVRVFDVPDSLKWKPRGVSAAPLIAAFGLALGDATDELRHFDFLHPKEPEADRRERVKQLPRIGAIAACFLIAAGWLAYQPIRHRNIALAAVEAQYDKAHKGHDERDDFMDAVDEVAEWEQKSIAVLDVLADVARVFPSNKQAYLTRFELTDKGQVEMELAAQDQYIGTSLNQSLAEIKDEDGKAVFVDASPGRPEANNNDKYPVKDRTYVFVKSLKPAEKKSRRGRR